MQNKVATIQRDEPGGKMKALVCEMCGSTDLVKENGLFVCQSCGIKYSLEEARKMMIDGTVNISGTVKVDNSENLKNLYILARRAKEEDNYENAEKYYGMILQDNPENWEASFYQVCYKAMGCKVEEITSAASAVKNCLKNTLSLIARHVPNETGKENAYCEMTNMAIKIASHFADAATQTLNGINPKKENQVVKKYTDSIFSSAQICYTLGDLYEPMPQLKKYSCRLWKKAIEIHVECIRHLPFLDQGSAEEILNKYSAKIKKINPDYKRPSSCYIATAVYGSYDCPEVWTLRRFRDYFLWKKWYGRLLVKMYYAVSPKLVKYFGHTRLFQVFWRKRLDKLVKKLNSQGVSNAPYFDCFW